MLNILHHQKLDKKDFSASFFVHIHLDGAAMGRIHSAITEAGDIKNPTLEECVEVLKKYPEILRKIIYLGKAETETEVYDLYEKLKDT